MTIHPQIRPDPAESSIPAPQPPEPSAALQALLRIEALARRASTTRELGFLIANETPKLTRARQIFVARVKPGQKIAVTAVSAVSEFDASSPLLTWVTGTMGDIVKSGHGGQRLGFALPEEAGASGEIAGYPFRHMLWLPLASRSGEVFAGMLLARDTAWQDQEAVLADRLAETYAHAWLALEPKAVRRAKKTRLRLALIGGGLLLAAGVLAFPVRMSVLAPMEVAATNGRVVTAPIDGIIDTLLVDANQPVKQGMPVIRLSDTALRNEAAIAAGELDTAEARLKRTRQAAISDPRMLREIALTRADVEVARAKLDYAREQLAQTVITAPADGVAVYSDKRDWTGRPVRTGERIMDLADPSLLEARIHIALSDSIAVNQGMTVRAFLDSDPLHALDATVVNASYEAHAREDGHLAYDVVARFDQAVPAAIRLGGRGTAEVLGEKVPLAYFLLRKPMTAARQWLGL